MAKEIKVLIVDDDEIFREVMRNGIEHEGYITETASDGEEALEKATSFKPNIMLLDVNMPKKTGFEVLKELKQNQKNKDLHIILCTGDSTTDIDEGFNLGADDCIYKPFDIPVVISRIERILKRYNIF
jgi:DNA-binding response OmpR family regulator